VTSDYEVDCAVGSIREEFFRATRLHGSFNSAHEGYAALLEEVDELWDAIKDKSANDADLRLEAIQVGAMAVRFLVDCVPMLRPEKGESDE
jgi:hypothetical protein